MNRLLRSPTFYGWFVVTLVVTGFLAIWELNLGPAWLPRLPRPYPTSSELYFAGIIVFLLSLNAGLIGYRSRLGTCPLGAKRATKLGGVLGAVTLLCPACLLIPISLFGLSLSLAALSPFVPLLRIITVILLVVSSGLLWPK